MLRAMQKGYLIEPGDAVIPVREASGRIKLNQLFQPVAHRGFRGAVGFSDRLAVHMPLPGARATVEAAVDARAKVAPTLMKER